MFCFSPVTVSSGWFTSPDKHFRFVYKRSYAWNVQKLDYLSIQLFLPDDLLTSANKRRIGVVQYVMGWDDQTSGRQRSVTGNPCCV